MTTKADLFECDSLDGEEKRN